MVIPQTNFNPPFNITRASHLVLTAQDLPASRDFLYASARPRRQRRRRQHDLSARRRGARHHSLTLKKTTGEPTCEASACTCSARKTSTRRNPISTGPVSRRNSLRCRFRRARCAFSTHGHGGRALRHHEDPAAAACRGAHAQGRPRAAHGSLSGAGAGRACRDQVLLDLGFRISDYIVVEGRRHGRRHVPLSQEQPVGHRVPASLGAALSSLWLRGRVDATTSCAASTPPATSVLPIASSTAPAGTGMDMPTTSTCAIRTDIAPSCCFRQFRLSTATTSRSPAWSTANPIGNRWGFPPPRSWFEEASDFTGIEIRRPPFEGEPLTLETYLNAKQWRRAAQPLRHTA